MKPNITVEPIYRYKYKYTGVAKTLYAFYDNYADGKVRHLAQ